MLVKLLRLFPLIIVFGISACRFADESHYMFVIPVEVTPFKSIFAVGDTIFLHMNINDSVYDVEDATIEKHRAENYPFYCEQPYFPKPDDHDSTRLTFIPMQANFKLILIKGTLDKRDNSKYYFLYSGHSYELTLALVPLTKGKFTMYFNSMEIPRSKNNFEWIYPASYATGDFLFLDPAVDNEKNNYGIPHGKSLGNAWSDYLAGDTANTSVQELNKRNRNRQSFVFEVKG